MNEHKKITEQGKDKDLTEKILVIINAKMTTSSNNSSHDYIKLVVWKITMKFDKWNESKKRNIRRQRYHQQYYSSDDYIKLVVRNPDNMIGKK